MSPVLRQLCPLSLHIIVLGQCFVVLCQFRHDVLEFFPDLGRLGFEFGLSFRTLLYFVLFDRLFLFEFGFERTDCLGNLLQVALQFLDAFLSVGPLPAKIVQPPLGVL